MIRVVVVALALGLAGPGPAAMAQTKPPAPAKTQPAKPGDAKPAEAAKPGEAPAEAETAPPPYEPQLLRLSEIMGALAFLRPLCGAADGPDWRKRMSGLIDAEANSPTRRDRLAGAFNKGYRGFALVYRSCTPSAQLAISRYLDEGGKLTRELTTRFGG
jgi:uncharacterized protein (TIGR02301 family)